MDDLDLAALAAGRSGRSWHDAAARRQHRSLPTAPAAAAAAAQQRGAAWLEPDAPGRSAPRRGSDGGGVEDVAASVGCEGGDSWLDASPAEEPLAVPHGTACSGGETDGAPRLDERAEEFATADFGLSRAEVLGRIERLALGLVASIAAGKLPSLVGVSTAASNVCMAAAADGGDDGVCDGTGGSCRDSGDESGGRRVGGGGARHVLRLGSRLQVRTLLGRGGGQAAGIARVLQLLDVVHGLLREGRSATQRDLYYTLLGPPFFSRPRDVTAAIHAALALLRVPRSALGIGAASKGAVAGRLLLRPRPGEAWQDCSLAGPGGRAIPGDAAAIAAMSLRLPAARCVLVVEKDAVFQRLVQERLFERLPCVLLTGRGMPDVASRAMLAALAAAAGPAVPVLGLVDWNPGGVAILAAYKLGSAGMGLEAAALAVPRLGWLGMTADMAGALPAAATARLTERDATLLAGLRRRLQRAPAAWRRQLDAMAAAGVRADLEGLYGLFGGAGAAGLADELVRRLLRGSYLPG